MPEPPVVLITGVSSGIGRTVAEHFTRRGFRTFGSVRRPDAVAPAGVELVRMDVRDDHSVQRAVGTVRSAAGHIDVLVNNAGVTAAGALEETTLAEAKELFETNFFGVLRVTRAVLPGMRERRRGRIVTIGSVGGFLPMPYQGIYSASKHALDAFSETLDHEVRGYGVRSVLVQPGYIRTEISNNASLPREPVAAYDEQRHRTARKLDQRIRGGDDPERVAGIVVRAATAPRPRLKYLAGGGARAMYLAWWLLPAALFGYGLRRHFALT